MGNLIQWAFKDAATQKRLFVSIASVVILAVVQNIPLPGIQVQNFSPVASQLFSPLHFSLFLLGIAPLFSACILLQIASAFVPIVKRWTFDDSNSRKNLRLITWLVTFLLTVVQAYLLSVTLENNGMSQFSGWSFRIFIVLTLCASVGFLIFFSKVIEQFGLGNGVALIAVSLALPELIHSFRSLFNDPSLLGKTLFVFLLSAGLFVTAYQIARRATFLDLTLGDKNQATVRLPFRPTVVAGLPRNVAHFILSIPLTAAGFISSETIEKIALVITNDWVHFILFLVLTGVTAHVYALLVFKPEHLYALMQRFGYRLIDTQSLPLFKLDRTLSQVLRVTILFIVAAAGVQILAVSFLGLSPALARSLLGWPIVILGGVASDVMAQIGFCRDRATSGISNWQICHVAGDEWEATLKAGYLTSQGIPALVEPLCFSWGLPTRTVVDEYRIYVPTECCEKVVSLPLFSPKSNLQDDCN